jgi:glycosyltransferase involved in cell wall biosynthesis
MVEVLKEGHIGVFAARLCAKFQYKSYKEKHHPKEGSAKFQYVADCVTPILPSLKKYGEYDLAISFLTPHNIVRDKVLAKKKLAWIHTDYSTIDVDVKKELPVWASYDKIFAVSEGVKNTFLKTFPSLSKKVDVFENILSEQFIREQSEIGIELAKAEMQCPITLNPKLSTLNLLSVGRFTSAKNFDNVPDICKRINCQLSIVNCEFRIRWFLIGFGGDEALIKKRIEEAGMQDYCIILGKKENPYPYMAVCDVYVQPSRYEGKAVTVREAQILCKPVIISNYKTAHSQVHDGIDGIIVPKSNEEMADAIVEFLQDKQKQREIVNHLQRNHYGNEDEASKLNNL